MHSPGCPQFSLPAPVLPSNPDPLRASASDVSVALREAMDKVTVYEHEVKMLQYCNLYDVCTIMKNSLTKQWKKMSSDQRYS